MSDTRRKEQIPKQHNYETSENYKFKLYVGSHGYLQFADEIPEVPGWLDEGSVEGKNEAAADVSIHNGGDIL